VLHYEEKRKKLIIFITWLHNKPHGCGASVASAARPFSTNNTSSVVKSKVRYPVHRFRHLSLPWARWIQSIVSKPIFFTIKFNILIFSFHQFIGLQSGLVPSSLPTKTLHTFPFFPLGVIWLLLNRTRPSDCKII
jgi:hypothetical protein